MSWFIKILQITQPRSLHLFFIQTSQAEFIHQMRSGDLLAHLSPSCHVDFQMALIHVLDALLFKFSQRIPFLRNSTCVRRTDTPSHRDTRLHLKSEEKENQRNLTFFWISDIAFHFFQLWFLFWFVNVFTSFPFQRPRDSNQWVKRSRCVCFERLIFNLLNTSY